MFQISYGSEIESAEALRTFHATFSSIDRIWKHIKNLDRIENTFDIVRRIKIF